MTIPLTPFPFLLMLAALLWAFPGLAELNVTVSSPKIVGRKAIVDLAMKNGWSQQIESARASVFLQELVGRKDRSETPYIVSYRSNLWIRVSSRRLLRVEPLG